MALVCIAAGVCAEDAGAGAGLPAGLSSVDVVQQMHVHTSIRIKELKHFTAVRHYQVEYKGYSATIVGRMDVEANYDAAQGMSFRIVSQSGSKFLCDKVLKRAIDSEQEASRDKRLTELTPANYKFQMVDNEMIAGGPPRQGLRCPRGRWRRRAYASSIRGRYAPDESVRHLIRGMAGTLCTIRGRSH